MCVLNLFDVVYCGLLCCDCYCGVLRGSGCLPIGLSLCLCCRMWLVVCPIFGALLVCLSW